MALDLKSFTAASTLPAKLLQNIALIGRIRAGFIPPIHVQLNPTNRCNLNCSFCSCSERDRKAELELDKLLRVMGQFKTLGCRSVTITGGGEPLLYPEIGILIKILNKCLRLKIGLVTNGTQFHHFTVSKDITWCRISSSDDREPCWEGIERAVKDGVGIDWAFSHVLTRSPDWKRLGRLLTFANQHNFTHVRIVGDLLDIEEAAIVVKAAREQLLLDGIDDSRVIYQDRAAYVSGRGRCGISLLKPVIGADGGIYPCCGVQYAQDPPGLDLVDTMRMGTTNDIDRIWKDQASFDGSVCSRCYYDNYNSILKLMTTPLQHREFI